MIFRVVSSHTERIIAVEIRLCRYLDESRSCQTTDTRYDYAYLRPIPSRLSGRLTILVASFGSAQWIRPDAAGVHADRTAGGDRYHRDPGGHAAPRLSQGQIQGASNRVPEQPASA